MAGTKKDSEKEYSSNWGGKRTGGGRPLGSRTTNEENALSVQVAVRMTTSEKSQLEERAKSENLTVSKYIHKLLFP